MGRRFSSHGLLISHARGFWQTLHRQMIPAACVIAPRPSAQAFLPCASTSFGALQAAVYLPASTSVRLHSLRRRLLHRAVGLRRRIKDARFCPTALHKLRTNVCFNGQGWVRRQPSGFLLRPSPALHSTLYEKLRSRSSLSTGSLAADRFNESCKTDTSGVSCRGIRPESRLLCGLPDESGSQR
jgi:hypothetical protein